MTNFNADPGDKIAYATMFGFSNDGFMPMSRVSRQKKGDLIKTSLFDSGTGVDQYPGAGNHRPIWRYSTE
jgi:hypothetical protein